MGFGSSSKQLIWAASGLSLLHVKQAIKSASKFNKPKLDCKQYIIDVDISWIIRKLGLGLTKESQIKKISQFLRTLSRDGFVVTPICDNKERHHSKRDSINRAFKREKARVDGLVARCQSIALATTVRQNGGKYSTEQIKHRNFLNKEAKKLEDTNFVTIPQKKGKKQMLALFQ